MQELALSQRLGVSRGPIREALGRLAAEGLVTVRPRRGAVVHSLSSEDFLQAYQVREALEGLAIRLAVPRLTPPELDELQRLTDTMQTCAASGRVTEFFEANAVFHERLVDASGNAKLQEIYRRLAGQMHRYWRRSLDGETAARLMADHIRVPQMRMQSMTADELLQAEASFERKEEA